MRPWIMTALICALVGGAPVKAAPDTTPFDLLAEGRYDEARAQIAKATQTLPSAVDDQAYFETLILRRQGQNAAAVRALRAILAHNPAYQPARRDLTMLLASQGQVAAARYHAERLVGETRDARLAAVMRDYLVATQDRAAKGVRLSFALVPSTNLNKGTDSATFDLGGVEWSLDDDKVKTSGVGLSLGLSAWNTWHLGERLSLVGAIDANVVTYPQADLPTESVLAAKLSLERRIANSVFSFGPLAEGLWLDQSMKRRRIGLGFGVRGVTAGGASWAVTTDHLWQRFPGSPERNGSLTRGALRYHKPLSSAALLKFTLPFGMEDTGAAHLDHYEFGLTVSLSQEWKNGLITDISLGAESDRFRGDYPGFGRPRRDDLVSIGLGLRHRNVTIGKFTPEIRYRYTRARSNIPLHRYRSHDVTVGLSTEF